MALDWTSPIDFNWDFGNAQLSLRFVGYAGDLCVLKVEIVICGSSGLSRSSASQVVSRASLYILRTFRTGHKRAGWQFAEGI